VKVEYVMENEHIDGLATNHSLTPLPKQEQMRALNVNVMESFFKIELKDVL